MQMVWLRVVAHDPKHPREGVEDTVGSYSRISTPAHMSRVCRGYCSPSKANLEAPSTDRAIPIYGFQWSRLRGFHVTLHYSPKKGQGD